MNSRRFLHEPALGYLHATRSAMKPMLKMTAKPIPSSFQSEEADPIILMKNYETLQQPHKVLETFQKFVKLSGEDGLGRLGPNDYPRLLNAIAKSDLSVQEADNLVQSIAKLHERFQVPANPLYHASMIYALAKVQSVASAMRYFYQLSESNRISSTQTVLPSAVYDAMIQVLAQNDRPAAALNMFENAVEQDKMPSISTIGILIESFSKINDMETAEKLFKMVKVPNETLYAAMIHGYGHLGQYSMASKYFRMAENNVKLSVKSWSGIVRAYCQMEDPGRAVIAMEMAEKSGILMDHDSIARVIKAYGKIKSLSKAVNQFYRYEHRGGFLPCAKMYEALMSVYVNTADAFTAWRIFAQIQSDSIVPTEGMYLLMAKVHSTRHQDYFRDLVKFAGVSNSIDSLISNMMKALLNQAAKDPEAPKQALSLYKFLQTSTFKHVSRQESSFEAIRALTLLNDEKKLLPLYESLKNHSKESKHVMNAGLLLKSQFPEQMVKEMFLGQPNEETFEIIYLILEEKDLIAKVVKYQLENGHIPRYFDQHSLAAIQNK
jgi:tetratricopeptide (TPR) repeat protein